MTASRPRYSPAIGLLPGTCQTTSSASSSATGSRSPPAYIERWRARNASTTALASGAGTIEPEDARGDANRQHLVVRCLSGERDHGALESPDERQRDRPRGRARGNRAVSPPGVDQANEPLDEPFLDPLELAPDRMVPAAELDPQGRRDAGDIATAEDGVTAGHREQRGDGVGFAACLLAHFLPPGLVGPA